MYILHIDLGGIGNVIRAQFGCYEPAKAIAFILVHYFGYETEIEITNHPLIRDQLEQTIAENLVNQAYALMDSMA